MNGKSMLIPVILFCFLFTGLGRASAPVTDDVKQTVDEVLKIVSDKELKKPENESKRRQELKKAIGRIFDYGEMAQRSMGRHWKQLSPANKKEFVGLFETLLENSYAGKIESYTNQKIVYGREMVEGDHAEVKSTVVTAKRDEYTLDYRLLKENERWMIYDVVIEGVSLVSNYRTQFNKIIQNQGYPELLKKMRQKREEISAPLALQPVIIIPIGPSIILPPFPPPPVTAFVQPHNKSEQYDEPSA